jgi:CorA-like Mg2+ transporter protein
MKTESTLLPGDWNVPAVFRQRLGESAGRQRVMAADGHLLLVLHAPPDADEPGRRGRFLWRDPDGNWKVAPRAERFSSLADHLTDYRTTIERVEQREETAQESREYFALLDHLAPLTRATRHLQDVLQKARETVPGERRLIVARDDAYDLARRAEILYDDVKNGLEAAVARQAEAQAESSHQMAVASYRLNILVALFFPIATLMAIFGTNLHHGLEDLEARYGPLVLATVTGLGMLLGVVITFIITRPAPRPQTSARGTPTSKQSRRH